LLTCVGLLLFSEGVIIFGATFDTVIPIQVFAQTSVALSMSIVSSSQSYSLWISTFKKYKKSTSSETIKTQGSSTVNERDSDEESDVEKRKAPSNAKIELESKKSKEDMESGSIKSDEYIKSGSNDS